MRRRWFPFIVVLASVPTYLRAGEPGAPDVTRHASADGRVAIELPADWIVAKADVEKSVLALDATLPTPNEDVWIRVYHLPGFRNPRSQAWAERDHQARELEEGHEHEGVVSLEPLPHLVMEGRRGTDHPLDAFLFRVIDRNGFSIKIVTSNDTWPHVRDACLRAAQSLTSTLPEWPARPDGYQTTVRDGYEYLVLPSVKETDVAALHAAVVALEKQYAKAHGAVAKPAWNRPIVVVSPDCSAAPELTKHAARPDDAYFADLQGGRLIATPLPRNDPQTRAELAEAATALFHVQNYGSACPWMREGDGRLAFEEAFCGRALPSVREGFLAEAPRNLEPFADVVRGSPANAIDQATVYMTLFRVGPQPWRDAFAAFLHELNATGDARAAEKHLLDLDQEKMRTAAVATLRDLKPVRTK